MDEYWLAGIADWLINLSAGWFGAAVVILTAKKPAKNKQRDRFLLTGNLILTIMCLFIAVHIRRSLGAL